MPKEGVLIEEWYYDCWNKYFKNEKFYAGSCEKIVVELPRIFGF